MAKIFPINISPNVLGDNENVIPKKADHEDVKKEILEGVDLLVSKDFFSDIMTCKICNELLLPERDPHFCNGCEKNLFCKSCIDKCLKNKKECPFCKKREPEIFTVL